MLLDGIGKRYRIGGPWVLRDVRLEVPPGRIVRIQGRNGSGKSTLLRVIAGIAEPSRGRVSGRPSTGYVPERFPAALPFTAGQYLRHHARMRGVAASQGAEWLERFGAARFAGTAMKELSKGTSQKIAVAQALLGDPELLVLDEAWTGLDVAARDELAAVVREQARGGARVVFVDHDATRLADATDERWVVRDGGLSSVVPAVASQHTVGQHVPSQRTVDQRTVDQRTVDQRTVDQRTVDQRTVDQRTVDQRTAISVTGVADTNSLEALVPEAAISTERDGLHRIVVDASLSDSVLRRLLDLVPEVHIVAVSQLSAQIRANEES